MGESESDDNSAKRSRSNERYLHLYGVWFIETIEVVNLFNLYTHSRVSIVVVQFEHCGRPQNQIVVFESTHCIHVTYRASHITVQLPMAGVYT